MIVRREGEGRSGVGMGFSRMGKGSPTHPRFGTSMGTKKKIRDENGIGMPRPKLVPFPSLSVT